MTVRIAWPAAVTVSLLVHGAALLAVSSVLARGTAPVQAIIELSAETSAIPIGEVSPAADDGMTEPVTAGDAAAVEADVVQPIEDPGAESSSVAVSDDAGVAEVVTEQHQAAEPANDATVAVESSVTAVPLDSDVPATAAAVNDGAVAPDVPSEPIAVLPEASPEAGTVVEETSASESTAPVPSVSGSSVVRMAESSQVEPSNSETVNALPGDNVAVPAEPTETVPATSPSAAQEETSVRVEPIAGEAQAVAVPGTAPAGTSVPAEAEKQVALVLPPRPPELPRPVDHRVAIANFMRENGTGDCFLAVPREIQRDGATVTGFAPKADDLASFERQFISATEAGLTLDRQMISPGQCAALELVGAMSPEVGGGLAVQIVEAEIGDGDDLVADITNVRLPYLNLVLVDDDGMAQDVSGFVLPVSGRLQFRAPLHLRANGRGRTQLLIALSSERDIDMLEFEGQRPAASVFPLAMGEARMRKLKTDVAIAAFRVR